MAEALSQLVGRPFSELKLAFIPTAANVEEGNKGWLIEDLVRFQKLGFEVDIVDFSAVSREIWEARLRAANVLFFEGGNTFHLSYCLEKTGLKEALQELLKTRVYVGASAGSMITSPNLILSQSSKLYYESAGKLQLYDQGLRYVNFHIRPHLNNPDFPKVKREYVTELAKDIKEPVYVLDDQSAVMVDEKEIKVISEGEWFKLH